MDNLNVVELSIKQARSISGGNRFKRLFEAGRLVLEAAGIVDAYNDFIDGWHDCAPEE